MLASGRGRDGCQAVRPAKGKQVFPGISKGLRHRYRESAILLMIAVGVRDTAFDRGTLNVNDNGGGFGSWWAVSIQNASHSFNTGTARIGSRTDQSASVSALVI